ncbi:MAG: VWA domain-containing protein, partial [Burkholderiales bacterium]|nr:VWA domain-containing protein [Anaerolineae bacterium]
RVALMTFSDGVELRVPLEVVETNRNQVYSHIQSLRAGGGTSLFAALQQAVDFMNQQTDEDRIRSVVLLSDGADTGDGSVSLNQVIQTINASRDELNPVIVIPVAYGSDADVNTLTGIARASATRVQSGDPENILSVLQIISSYF